MAAKEKLNAKYLAILWKSLADKTPSHPLDAVRTRWKLATEKDAPAIAAEIGAWLNRTWGTLLQHEPEED